MSAIDAKPLLAFLAAVALAGCGSSGGHAVAGTDASSASSGGDSSTGSSGGSSGAGGSSSGGAGSSGGSTSSGGSGGSGSSGGTASSGDAGFPYAGILSDGGCESDPLHTGLVATQTGVSVDAFDCPILQWAAHYNEPDPMIFKGIIYVESRFDDTAVACPNLPCGTPSGWTAAESGCLGLMQVVPACGGDPGDAGLLTNGQPNMTTDAGASGWATSIFNPEINIEIGIAGIASNRAQDEAKFPGCTQTQYTMMAIGDYNEYGSTKSCTEYNDAYDDGVISAYTTYATAAAYPARSYTP
jgi:hypothetical protein